MMQKNIQNNSLDLFANVNSYMNDLAENSELHLSNLLLVLLVFMIVSSLYCCYQRRKNTVPGLKGYSFGPSKKIGAGAFGIVYESTITKDGNSNSQKCAVKEMMCKNADPSVRREWENETKRLLAVKNHYNVVTIIGAEIEPCNKNGLRCRIVTELAPKGDLTNNLSRGWFSSTTWKVKLKFARGICAGLKHIHRKGVIHLDLKSDNVLIGKHGEPKINDFGRARYRCNSILTSEYRGPFFGGDINYIAPECMVSEDDVRHAIKIGKNNKGKIRQILNKRISKRITTASDMFSLGILMWEVASGCEAPSRTLDDVYKGKFPGNTHESRVKFFRPIILGCIKRNPKDRLEINEVIAHFADKDSIAEKLDKSSCVMM